MDNNNNLSPGFKKIPLRGKNGAGKFAIVDHDDYARLSRYRWYCVRGYVKRTEHYRQPGSNSRSTRTIAMHREIMSPPDNMVVDHKNHNKLDNRKKNLRVCTHSENQLNNRAKGYCWDNTSRRWRVTVKEDGKYRYRSYVTEGEAKEAVKMVRSGNIPPKKVGMRSRYLSRYISFNGPASYYFRCTVNGKKYCKYGFKTVAEAVLYRDNFLSDNNINLLERRTYEQQQ